MGKASLDKDLCALTPPMGWNSYDYYDTTVNEEQVKANADYMAKHLKDYGWEYVVIDIEWYSYDTGSQRDRYQYIPFWEMEMDEYGRLLPCPQRFPSSAGGKGFGPLAEYVHALGLKFGIHIMRGIPRMAAHRHLPVYGSEAKANEIADPSNICFWNPDMYGLRPGCEGSQAYYDSIMELYAQWGVDFIKCDDICRMDMPSAKAEIAMLHTAIERCGRPIVLSLSPGPAKIEEAWLYEQHANMWRITDDFWDNWKALKDMFWRCELWQSHVSPGCFPDCDMLPLGKIGKAFGTERDTGFTKTEQITMMNLWCIFRAPLMIGAELTKLDDFTESLLTNKCLLECIHQGGAPRQISRDRNHAVWMNQNSEDGSVYLALFNLSDEGQTVSAEGLKQYGIDLQSAGITNAWAADHAAQKTENTAAAQAGEVSLQTAGDTVLATLPAHGSAFFVLR